MQIKTFLLFFVLLLLILSCNDNKGTLKAPGTQENGTPNEDAMEIIFYDEFKKEGLPDPQKWSFDTGTGANGWGNWELQYYTKADIVNAFVSNGTLKIRALPDQMDDPYETYEHFFTSAKVSSKCGFKYGKFEIKAKMTGGFGMWPAVWMLPFYRIKSSWPTSGEIDIIEHVGRTPDEVFVSVHTAAFNYWGGTPKSKKILKPGNWESEFHVYTLDWSEKRLEWFVDGVSKYVFEKKDFYTEKEWPFDKPFGLIMNLAIGGNFGFPPGTPREINMPLLDRETFPKVFEIDYVRVYGNKKNMVCNPF